MDHTPRILIVDRDPVAGEVLRQQLAALGYTAVVVRTGDEAIEALERARSVGDGAPFGVVLADQDARGMERGMALVRALHQDWPAVVPVVISGFRKVESAVLAMRLGAADYLLKPIVEAELADAVRRAVQRHLLQVHRATQQEPVPAQAEATDTADQQGEDARAAHRPEPDGGWTPMPLSEAMKEPEKRILLAALDANGWNRGQTAQQLDINRTTLYKKIRQYRLDEPG